MSGRLRWGIVGLGRIAHQFVADLALVDSSHAVAAAARDMSRARTFAQQHNIARAHGSYDDLFKDDEVDIVYIATPHDSHAELSIRALDAGKHVLCEKPIAINRRQAEGIVAASKRNGRFLMEALWSRFNPSIRAVLSRVRSGELGDIRYLTADLAFRADTAAGSRLLDMKRGGGSLLDVGIYPLFLAYATLGIPDRIVAEAVFHEAGADLHTAMLLNYGDALAVLYGGFVARSNSIATISGTKGRITLNTRWHEPDSYTLYGNEDGAGTTVHHEREGRGYCYEIVECLRCIGEGRTESSDWSHRNSLDLMAMLDEVRKIVGLRYAADDVAE